MEIVRLRGGLHSSLLPAGVAALQQEDLCEDLMRGA
jgi:hypothetical protein